MFQKTFNRLALLCVIRLGSYTQQLHNKTPNDQELQFSFSSYVCQFSHNLCILTQEPQCATLGAVVISTLKKKVPVIYLFAGFQE